jgi:hypothetical protein
MTTKRVRRIKAVAPLTAFGIRAALFPFVVFNLNRHWHDKPLASMLERLFGGRPRWRPSVLSID